MGFNDDPGWVVVRTIDPLFGGSGAGAISADWTITSGAQTPRDYQRWGAYEAGMANTLTTNGSMVYSRQPLVSSYAFRMSWDLRVSTYVSGIGPQIIAGIFNGSGGSVYGTGPRYYPPDGGSYWWILSGVGKWDCGGLTANRYYHIGIKKLGTAFSIWWEGVARGGPIGAAGDSYLSQILSGTVSPLAASASYLGAYTAWPEVINDIDYGSWYSPHYEELGLVTSGGTGGGAGGAGSGGFPVASTNTDLSLHDIEESAAYHRYKTLRAAANTYSYLRPWA